MDKVSIEIINLKRDRSIEQDANDISSDSCDLKITFIECNADSISIKALEEVVDECILRDEIKGPNSKKLIAQC